MGTSRVADSGGRSSIVLVLSSAWDEDAAECCIDHLTPAAAGELDALVVTYPRSTTQVIDEWQHHAGDLPANLGIIDVGGVMRSASDSAEASSTTIQPGVTVATHSPEDLTGLGITISECLTQHDEEHQLTVCFDSVTALLQYTDTQTAFQFLHVLTGKIRAANGQAHFHLNPEAHDSQTLATLKLLFDDVVELD